MNFADQEEIAERQQRRRSRQRRDATWNAFTGFIIFLAVVAMGYLGLIFFDPSLPLNPFPPPTMPVVAGIILPTPTLYVLPATATVTAAPSSTATSVPPTATQTPEPTYEVMATTAPVAITSDPNALYPFELKSNPIPMSSMIFHPDGNCNWQGVAGQVVDLLGRPVVGLSVHLTGTYAGKPVDMTTLTGGAQAWYGESGFEFVLGQTPIASSDLLTLQLADQGMLAVSDGVTFDTYAACEKNLVLINFRQVR